jgi:hypothetical protein
MRWLISRRGIAAVVCLLMLLALSIKAQTPKVDFLVTAEITGAGELAYNNDQSLRSNVSGLFVKLAVQNNSQIEKSIWFMNCSWQENWLSDHADMFLYRSKCLRNYPERTTLKPQESIVFYGILVKAVPIKGRKREFAYVSPTSLEQANTLNPLAGKIMFGFREINNYENRRDFHEQVQEAKTWWSNPVNLNFHNHSFHKQ